MVSDPPAKTLKNEGIDRISYMPDSILGKILSYLPTKDALATSFLSTRWKHVLPFGAPPITIELDGNVPTSSSSSFMNFVDKLLNETLRHVPCVERITIRCRKVYCDEKIVSWVCAALRLNVVHLHLIYTLNNSKALFHCLNGCKTLVELELGNEYRLCVPEEFVLPNLKRLFLQQLVLCDNMKSTHNLLEGCPLLEDLSFNFCEFGTLDTLFMQPPLLKKLFIENCSFGAGFDVEIDAPNLEVFVYEGYCVADCVVANFRSLHSVCFGFYYFPYGGFSVRRLVKLVKACSSTIRLGLFEDSIMILNKSSAQLPIFKNLTCLAFGFMESHGFEVLARLLKIAPNLQTLTTEQGFEKCSGGYARFESLLPTLPVCLKICLKKIEFWEFEGGEDEFKLIEYFLKNGSVLQEVAIHYLPCVDTSMLNRLLVFPKHSKMCQVLLKGKAGRSSTPSSRVKWVTEHV